MTLLFPLEIQGFNQPFCNTFQHPLSGAQGPQSVNSQSHFSHSALQELVHNECRVLCTLTAKLSGLLAATPPGLFHLSWETMVLYRTLAFFNTRSWGELGSRQRAGWLHTPFFFFHYNKAGWKQVGTMFVLFWIVIITKYWYMQKDVCPHRYTN